MITRLQFENSNEVGVFIKLTNKYCILSSSQSANAYATIQSVLNGIIPIIRSTIGGTRLIGRLTVANSKGILVPKITTDNELRHLRNSLEDDILIERVEERLSALGNVIACNDYIALVHPEIDSETENIISDVLGVEVFKEKIGNSFLVGTNCVLNNQGILVNPNTTIKKQETLSTLTQLPVISGTVNHGSELIGSGLVVNDWCSFTGLITTPTEIAVMQNIFKFLENRNDFNDIKKPLIDTMI